MESGFPDIKNEILIGKKNKFYRFFEMLPALLTFSTFFILIVFAVAAPRFASYIILAFIVLLLIKGIRVVVELVVGTYQYESSLNINYKKRLNDISYALSDKKIKYSTLKTKTYKNSKHINNLKAIIKDQSGYINPGDIYNAVIVAVYNEPYEVIKPAIESIKNSYFDKKKIIVILAYEETGGDGICQTAISLQQDYKDEFFSFDIVCHPKNLSGEIRGKGSNISYAGRFLHKKINSLNIDPSSVLVTTLDSDNIMHPSYLSAAAYEYIINTKRDYFSFQPVSLYLNNIWDAPAPTRLIASGNSLWNIVCSVRKYSLRNFASHSQGLKSLIDMNFWSKRTIVEDGHQYWRSYFHFSGNYRVKSIKIPIYQDAVYIGSFWGSLLAQSKQLKRWAYGASDIPFVAYQIYRNFKTIPKLKSLFRLFQLIDSHISLACATPIILFAPWLPYILSLRGNLVDAFAWSLPGIISSIEQIAMVGTIFMIWFSIHLLPKKPERYSNIRFVFVIAQWCLLPFTSLIFNSYSAIASQTRLLFGIYQENFVVTQKINAETYIPPKGKFIHKQKSLI